MNNEITMILTFLAGITLGILFFGGLWFTVKKSVAAKKPTLLIISSFFLRISITMVGFYFLGGNSLKNFLACLLGFITARFIFIYITKKNSKKNLKFTKK